MSKKITESDPESEENEVGKSRLYLEFPSQTLIIAQKTSQKKENTE